MREPVLSERQVACLAGKAAGKNNEEIAGGLGVCQTTVAKELYVVYRLLGAKNGPAAVAEGYRRGLLEAAKQEVA